MTEETAIWAYVGEVPECQHRRQYAADWFEDRAGMVDCRRCKSFSFVPCPDCIHWKGRVPKDCLCRGRRRITCGVCLGTGRVSNGNAETAAALRATASRMPRYIDASGDYTPGHYWNCIRNCGEENKASKISKEEFFALTGGTPDDVYPDYWRYYNTAADAIRDLCRAWVASRSKQEVPT